MRRVVTLFGTILNPTEDTPVGSFVLDVDSRLGDAKEFALAGQITFARRQCHEISESPDLHGKDIVRIPEHIAQLKSELAGNIRKRRKR